MSGSDSSDEIEEAQKEQQELLQQQIDQNNAEIEQKRQSVFDQRINIIKSQGAPTWTPGKPSVTPQTTLPSGKVVPPEKILNPQGK
jgi:hypothetical protein